MVEMMTMVTRLTSNRRIALAVGARRIALTLGALLASAALGPAFGSQAAATAPPAPKAPSVSTGGFTVVGASSVTLKGSVNPRGLATVYAFQFGTTTGYGAQMAPVTAGNGTTGVTVSQTITGLSPGITYHYRLIATNAAGTSNGKDAIFTIKVPLTFKLAATPNPGVFGSSFTVSGVLSGTGATNHEIVLQSNPFPYLSGFKNAAGPELTDSAGRFSFAIANLTETTQFRVVTVGLSAVNSPVVLERVAVRVSLHLRSTGRSGFVRMYGAVEPAEVGAPVIFQLLRRGLPPRSIATTTVLPATASASRFSQIVRIHHRGLYRALVRVNNGQQTSGHSRAILIG